MKPKICDKNTSFSDCELLILRLQVDESDKKQKRKVQVEHSAELNDLISILEDYLKRKKKCLLWRNCDKCVITRKCQNL